MISRKQQIYCELVHSGLTLLRGVCWSASAVKTDELDRYRDSFRIGAETANFLHNVHLSILEPDFVTNDISFINLAIPAYLNRLGDGLPPRTAQLIIEFYNLVPNSLRHRLTWRPDDRLVRFASQDMTDHEVPSENGPN